MRSTAGVLIRMGQRWVFNGRVLAGIGLLLVVYALLAEQLGFDLLGLRSPSTSVLNHRLSECMFVWVLLCVAVGWLLLWRMGPPGRRARAWPVVLVPILIGVWLAAVTVWAEYGEIVNDRSLTWWVPLVLAGYPPVMGGMLGGALFCQVVWWKRFSPPEGCPLCEYDLTGNVSGKCPECGSHIETDRRIGREWYRSDHRFYPELSLFPTAGERHAAFREAVRRGNGGVWGRSANVGFFVLAFVVLYVNVRSECEQPSPVLWALAPCACVYLLLMRHWVRQHLREQLREAGIIPGEPGVIEGAAAERTPDGEADR